MMKADLEAHLSGIGFAVITNYKASGYFDGLVFVLPDTYDKTGTYDLNVIAAVVPGQDVESFTDSVFTACVGSGYEPSIIEFTYGQSPIPGRGDMPPADFGAISVQSSGRFGERNA